MAATGAGHEKALRWAHREYDQCGLVWAIEDCQHLSARLERDLLTADQQVVRVPPKMMAEHRRTARTRGKSDPIDALAVARAAAREPGLPIASHDEVSRELKLLVDRRETLVRQRTATINSMLWRVHDRMTRSGNRQLNAALHRIAVTQIRLPDSLGKAYHEKKKAEGMSTPEALRCLKRRLARVVFHHLQTDNRANPETCVPAAA